MRLRVERWGWQLRPRPTRVGDAYAHRAELRLLDVAVDDSAERQGSNVDRRRGVFRLPLAATYDAEFTRQAFGCDPDECARRLRPLVASVSADPHGISFVGSGDDLDKAAYRRLTAATTRAIRPDRGADAIPRE